jgi:uncharacterized protein (TIGR03435 family)
MYRLLPIIFVALGTLRGQQPTFEVASIKPSTERSVRGSDGGPGSKDPTRYTFGQVTVLDLIMVGWHVDPFQVSSKLPLDQQRFDFVAKLPPDATREQFRAMLQNFLADRFHLKAHMESKEFPGYALVEAKTGFRLNPPQSGDDAFPVIPEGRPGLVSNLSNSGGYILVRTRARQQPLSVLARAIRLPDNSPILDQTGVNGKYDFTFEYTLPLSAGASSNVDPPPVPDLFEAIQRQLGLQLVRKKLPFDVVVVDSVDKTPTAN